MHPLTPDLTKVSDQDLGNRVRDLGARLNQAYRFGNPNLVAQISMLLEDYQGEMARRQQAELEKLMNNNQDKFKGIIDIS
jgi:hypothetical protein